jgi:ribose/xylose/arabinose/galactoside ABC-type transport system permease subunit
VLFGGLIGFVNGFNVSVLGLPPFIATLGMMLVASGLSLVISGTKRATASLLAGLSATTTPVPRPETTTARWQMGRSP